MFSQGQLVFAACFFLVFVIAMFYAYRKDIVLHRHFYRGNYKILIGFLLFIGFLFLIKVYLKH